MNEVKETNANLTVTRICHSCVLLDFDGFRVLTDPWFSEKSGYYRGEPLAMQVSELGRLDAVIVSHDHYDHYDVDAFKNYSDKNIPFIVKRGIAEKAIKAGFTNVTEVDAWESVKLGPVTITATPAKHIVPEVTFILQSENNTVFFGGDTLFIPELQEVAKRFPQIDVALLPVNGLTIRPLFNRQVVMSAKEAAEACVLFSPRIAIPIHYKFTGGSLHDRLLLKYKGTGEEFVRYVQEKAPKTEVRVLSPGEQYAYL